MDDIIFEKDYRETESVEYDKWCDEVFDRAVNGGMNWRNVSSEMPLRQAN